MATHPFTYETEEYTYSDIRVKMHILTTFFDELRKLTTEEEIDRLLNTSIDDCKKVRNLTSNAARLVNHAYKAYTNLHGGIWKDGFAPLNAEPNTFYDNFKKTYTRRTPGVATYEDSYEYEVFSKTQNNILVMVEDLTTGEFVATVLAKNDGMNSAKWGPYEIYESIVSNFSVQHLWSINSFAANGDYPGIGSILLKKCIHILKTKGATSIVLEVYYVDACDVHDDDCQQYSRDRYQTMGATRLISTGKRLIKYYNKQNFVEVGDPKKIQSTLLNWKIQKMILSEHSKGGNRASRRRKKTIIKSKKNKKSNK